MLTVPSDAYRGVTQKAILKKKDGARTTKGK